MIAFMSAEMWLKSEFFYYSIVPVLLVVGLVALLLLLILLLYRENRRQGLIWLPVVVLLLCGGGFLLGDHFFTTLKMTMHKLRQISAIGKNALSDINIMIRARWRLISESKVKPFLLWGSIKQNRLAEKSNFWVLRTTLCISN